MLIKKQEMILSDDYFKKLCSEVSQVLQLKDKNALGGGKRVSLEGVDFCLILNLYQDQYARLILDLDELKPGFKPEIYETMLPMQGILDDISDGIFDGSFDPMFDYDSIRSCLMFRVKLPININTSAEELASIIQSFVLQIIDWRHRLLKNKLLLEEQSNSQDCPSA